MSADEIYALLLAETEWFVERTGAVPAWQTTGSEFGTPGAAETAYLAALAVAVAAKWPR